LADSLTVLDEIKKALFPLREEELTALETSVLAEGIRDPLVVWPRDGQLILVDGHYRYQLAQKHNLPFKIVEKHFANLEEALAWVDQNQLARRNLTDEQRRYLLGRIYERRRKAVGRPEKSGQSDQIFVGETAKRIASVSGVGEKTVRRAAVFAKALEAVKQISPEAADRILKGEVRDALVLGLTLNIARRHLSIEQIREIQQSMTKDKELRKKLAFELRKRGKTQAEAAAIVGVHPRTVDEWESNFKIENACIPDLRVKAGDLRGS